MRIAPYFICRSRQSPVGGKRVTIQRLHFGIFVISILFETRFLINPKTSGTILIKNFWNNPGFDTKFCISFTLSKFDKSINLFWCTSFNYIKYNFHEHKHCKAYVPRQLSAKHGAGPCRRCRSSIARHTPHRSVDA